MKRLDKGETLRQQDGFTLIELLLSLAIGMMLMSVVTAGLYQFTATTRLQQSNISQSQQIQSAMSMLNRDLVSAASGTISEDGLTLNLLIPTFEFGSTAGAITETVTYSLMDDDRLVRTGGQRALTIARGLATVRYGEPGAMITETVRVTMQARPPTGSGQTGFGKTVVVRRRLE